MNQPVNHNNYQARIDRAVVQNMLAVHLATLQTWCHGLAAEAGWWKDPKTGEPIDPHDKNVVGTKIALMHSELSEALEGHRKALMDDKLPHLPMIAVEFADAIIRILDTAGAMGLDVPRALAEKLAYNATRADHKLENRLKEGGKAY
ncbi:hypothetical protein D3C87_1645200 [compost metagenome]